MDSDFRHPTAIQSWSKKCEKFTFFSLIVFSLCSNRANFAAHPLGGGRTEQKILPRANKICCWSQSFPKVPPRGHNAAFFLHWMYFSCLFSSQKNVLPENSASNDLLRCFLFDIPESHKSPHQTHPHVHVSTPSHRISHIINHVPCFDRICGVGSCRGLCPIVFTMGSLGMSISCPYHKINDTNFSLRFAAVSLISPLTNLSLSLLHRPTMISSPAIQCIFQISSPPWRWPWKWPR